MLYGAQVKKAAANAQFQEQRLERSRQLLSSNTLAGALRTRDVFLNPDDVLMPGDFLRVRVPMGQARPAFPVTDRAVDNDQGQKILYIPSVP